MKETTFALSLSDRCLALAAAQAWEINGDIDRIDPADLESIMARLTESNLEETADELAQLAAWCS
jgi:hypothetical protein